MSFDPSVLFDAAQAVGMLATATRYGRAPAAEFNVGFTTPGALILGDAVHTDDIEVEYVSTAAPDLRVGERLSISGTDYRVRQQPLKQGDGYFSRVKLEVLSA